MSLASPRNRDGDEAAQPPPLSLGAGKTTPHRRRAAIGCTRCRCTRRVEEARRDPRLEHEPAAEVDPAEFSSQLYLGAVADDWRVVDCYVACGTCPARGDDGTEQQQPEHAEEPRVFLQRGPLASMEGKSAHCGCRHHCSCRSISRQPLLYSRREAAGRPHQSADGRASQRRLQRRRPPRSSRVRLICACVISRVAGSTADVLVLCVVSVVFAKGSALS